MTLGFSNPEFPNSAPRLTGTRAALTLAVSTKRCEQRSLNIHAVLNLLNRFVATEDSTVRDELVGRLADYMAAAHRVETAALIPFSRLCDLMRCYAAMRYLMADAIEPRIDVSDHDFSLRTEQAPEMMAFLQGGIDSLLADYRPSVHLSIRRFAWWQIEITLSIFAPPGQQTAAPPEWSSMHGGKGYCRSARFTAIARPVKRN